MKTMYENIYSDIFNIYYSGWGSQESLYSTNPHI
jgi:hypothetical protein